MLTCCVRRILSKHDVTLSNCQFNHMYIRSIFTWQQCVLIVNCLRNFKTHRIHYVDDRVRVFADTAATSLASCPRSFPDAHVLMRTLALWLAIVARLATTISITSYDANLLVLWWSFIRGETYCVLWFLNQLSYCTLGVCLFTCVTSRLCSACVLDRFFSALWCLLMACNVEPADVMTAHMLS